MAEINYNNLYNQMGLLDQKFYDSTFKNTYDPNKSQTMLEGKSSYDKMKAAYEAQQQVPEKSFISSAMSALNPFSKLSAAEMPQVPNLSLGTPQINFNDNTGITSTIPSINGVPMINTGAYNQKLQNTDLVSQIIAANQAANANKFGNTVAPFPGNQVPQVNNQVPFNDFYGSVYEPYDEEKSNEQVDKIPGQFSLKDSLSSMGRKMGISSLIGMLTGNPIIGLLSKGLGSLRGGYVGPKGSTGYGNDSSMSLFRRSTSGKQFFQGLRDKRAREDAAKRGTAKQVEAARLKALRAIRGTVAPTGGGGGGNPGTTTGGSSRDAGTGGTFGTSSNNNSSFSDYS
tara:strand:+ start:32 stop:1057 length:1026 start_codon:yes stop_codon:yes gene_type:complete